MFLVKKIDEVNLITNYSSDILTKDVLKIVWAIWNILEQSSRSLTYENLNFKFCENGLGFKIY